MIDFLKLETYTISQIDYFKNHILLNWVSDTDKINIYDNEVITTKKVKQYKGIYFCFYSNKLEIRFKPHYYFNDNLHNANDFSIIDCINTIIEVKNVLKIDLQAFKVVNIEYGLNCISPIDIKDLITYLAYHEKNEFRTDIELAYSKKSYSVSAKGTANEYKIIKAYAKGLQFPNNAHINTFRFEVKSKKSRFINPLGINTAKDLLNSAIYLALTESLIKEFEKVLILDCATDYKSLTQKEQNKIAKYNNPMEWYKINNSSNRNSFSKNKTAYHKLTDKVPNNLKNQLWQIIYDKLEELKKGAISQPKDIIKKGADSQLYNRGICTYNETTIDTAKTSICKVTGLNLCDEKEGAKYALTATLKKLKETNPETFELIKLNLLSKSRCKPKFEQSEISHLTKQIRNQYFNSFKIKQKGYNQPVNYFQHSQLNILTQLGI
ncbi:hypothetical protein EOD40_04760 [Flavobacterium sufflavum]|uniref:Replication-associated protein G2P N-terminal domain-containing protein n=1 Tax=Flavobacterium sufflavum TaxID=1921138 RepID=A0A437L0K0_9FLAO|nr:hypothetical protein [Flavobacterium sufflavum]RVT78549.1 hypothetical protein EOD40_04760 [Flavobacterium sufflavum]